jgi:hypothetical protein
MKKGYTLLEFMTVVGLCVLFFALTFGMFYTTNLSWDVHNLELELQQEERKGMEAMVREMYQTNSNHIQLSLDPDGDDRFFVADLMVPVIISSDTDVYDESGNIRWGADGNHQNYWIRYYVNTTSRQLLREVLDNTKNTTGISRVYANNIASVLFDPTPDSPALPEMLTIRITGQKPLRSGSAPLSTTLVSDVTFRN